MCGIFGYIGKNNNAANLVLEGLKTLEYRGYDSWGIATLKSPASPSTGRAKIIIKKKIGEIGNANVNELLPSNFALGHTRWATHGGVTDVNAHPHLDCTGQFALIHNGIIENYDEIKKDLVKSGHKFISQTDSEVALHLIEENYRKLKNTSTHNIFLEAVRTAFKRFVGLNAIIVMDAFTQTLVAVKNGSPLVIGKGRQENFLASDAHALFPYTKEVFFMEDNQMVLITDESIKVFELMSDTTIEALFTHLDWNEIVADKGKFDHFMLKEIFDQPKVLRSIISSGPSQIKDITKQIKHSYGTYLVGCGTAAYACLAGTYLFSKVTKRHVNFAVGSEFGYFLDFLTNKSLVLALSQSGETIDVIDTIKKAKEKGAQIGGLVNVLGSTLYRMSDLKLLLGAGTEKAVVSTKAFTAKLAYLILMVSELAGSVKSGREDLEKGIAGTENILQDAYLDKVKTLVDKIKKNQHIYVIGRGLSYPIALETALKIKEASYIHAEGFAAGELKHGVIALIEKGTPCIAFLPNDETYGANLAGAMELKARGGYIIGISYKNHEIFDYFLPVSDSGIASLIPSVIVGQLLGYYLAISRNLNPDRPRNLAKSVTVK